MTPRIVRLLATDRLHVDHGLVASRLLAAGWRGWAPIEQEAAGERLACLVAGGPA